MKIDILSREAAEELARFIIAAVADGLDLICQCEYGQSRSPACAAAIREFYDKNGISVFADYRYYPNQLIFNKVLQALRGATGAEEKDSGHSTGENRCE